MGFKNAYDKNEPFYFLPTKVAGITRYWKDGGGGGDAPDYVGAANAEAAGNLELAKYQTEANRANQYTPWGSLTWTQDNVFDQVGYDAAMAQYQRDLANYNERKSGLQSIWQSAGGGADGGGSWIDVWADKGAAPAMPTEADYWSDGKWNQQLKLDDRIQSALDDQIAVQGGRSEAANTLLNRVQGNLSELPDYSSAGQILDISQFNPADANQFAQAAYNAQTALLDPTYARQEDQLRNKLALQGLSNTSEAFGSDMDNFYRQKNAAYNQLAEQSMLTGQQVARNNYDSAIKGTTTQNLVYQQKLADLMDKYNQPLNQLNALLTGQQVSSPQFPGYAGMNQVGGADLLGAAQAQGSYNQAMANADAASEAATWNAVGSLGSSALMAYFLGSDIRIKENIVDTGATTDMGFPIYFYNYIGDDQPQVGVMAQDVEKVLPEAVTTMDNGYKAVLYGLID